MGFMYLKNSIGLILVGCPRYRKKAQPQAKSLPGTLHFGAASAVLKGKKKVDTQFLVRTKSAH
jgi:hypothetical protein